MKENDKTSHRAELMRDIVAMAVSDTHLTLPTKLEV